MIYNGKLAFFFLPQFVLHLQISILGCQHPKALSLALLSQISETIQPQCCRATHTPTHWVLYSLIPSDQKSPAARVECPPALSTIQFSSPCRKILSPLLLFLLVCGMGSRCRTGSIRSLLGELIDPILHRFPFVENLFWNFHVKHRQFSPRLWA